MNDHDATIAAFGRGLDARPAFGQVRSQLLDLLEALALSVDLLHTTSSRVMAFWQRADLGALGEAVS